MGAVQDRSGITLALVKARLGTDGSDDDLVQEILDAALEAADLYLNNAFLDELGAELPIPARVKRGVYKLISQEYGAGDDGAELEAKSFKEGDVSITYHSWEERADAVANVYWRAYRLEPGL